MSEERWYQRERLDKLAKIEEIGYILQRDNEEAPIPRSLEESPDYQPNWRSETVLRYIHKHCEVKNGEIIATSYPQQETDAIVANYFLFLGRRECEPELLSSIQWAHRAMASNTLDAMASRLKAFIIAPDISIQEIADHFHTVPQNVAMFCELFFDINRYRHLDYFIARIAFPPVGRTSDLDWMKQERTWMGVGASKGKAGLERIFLRKTSALSINTAEDDIRRGVTFCALHYIDLLKTESVPRPHCFEKFMMMNANELLAKQITHGEESKKSLGYVLDNWKGKPKEIKPQDETPHVFTLPDKPKTAALMNRKTIEAEIRRLS